MDRRFKHSGKLGDIIFALPAIRALGGGMLYLRPDDNLHFNIEAARSSMRLLQALPYVSDVKIWKGESVDYDLDAFRKIASPNINIADSVLTAINLALTERDTAWIPADIFPKIRDVNVVFARALGRNFVDGFWESVHKAFGDKAVFVGTSREHESYIKSIGPIEHFETEDLFDVAALISNSRIFIGSQSCPNAIAEGMKKNSVLEVDPVCPNCSFDRRNQLQISSPSDLWMIPLAEELLVAADPTTSSWFMTTDLELDATLSEETANAESLRRFMLKLRAKQPIKLCVRNKSHWSQALNVPMQISAEIDDELTYAGDPKEIRSMLGSQLYKITKSEAVAHDLPQWTTTTARAASVLGIEEYSLLESLRLLEVHFEAEPIKPMVDAPTVGQLGPATLQGASVIVLTYNSAHIIEQCLESVSDSLGPNDELIIVDNASSDGTQELVISLIQGHQARLITNESNLGYSAGINVGLRASRGRFLITLNPDTVVPKDWISKLTRGFVDTQVAAIGPITNCVTGLQFIGFNTTEAERQGLNLEETGQLLASKYHERCSVTKLLIGFCLAFRRSILDQVGLLDESLFYGSDDLEICLRLRSHGYRLLIAHDTFVFHVGAASSLNENSKEVHELLAHSTESLKAKLHSAFGHTLIPSSIELWGSSILEH